MNSDWKIRVQPSKREPFLHEAVFVRRVSGGEEDVLERRYAYGDGDLAVLLEDLGALVPEICRLLDAVHARECAEILVNVPEESMEMLSRRRPSPRA
ncbi:MAG: hypothetical protein WAU32_04565 [Thermoanaerobaculia bacterium]